VDVSWSPTQATLRPAADRRAHTRHRNAKSSIIRPLVLAGAFLAFGACVRAQPSFDPIFAALDADIGRLKELQQRHDLGSAGPTIQATAAKWKKANRRGYIGYVLSGACNLLGLDWGDFRKQGLLLDNLMISVLNDETLAPSYNEEVLLASCLIGNPRDVPAQEWIRLRAEKARLLLRTWKHVVDGIDPTFDVNNPGGVMMNVPPPPGVPGMAGGDPAGVKDPVLRKRWEDAIAENGAKIEGQNRQFYLRDDGMRFIKVAEWSLIDAYSRPPYNTPELKRLLDEYVSYSLTRERILINVAAR
jgi:hypothetical protein